MRTQPVSWPCQLQVRITQLVVLTMRLQLAMVRCRGRPHARIKNPCPAATSAGAALRAARPQPLNLDVHTPSARSGAVSTNMDRCAAAPADSCCTRHSMWCRCVRNGLLCAMAKGIPVVAASQKHRRKRPLSGACWRQLCGNACAPSCPSFGHSAGALIAALLACCSRRSEREGLHVGCASAPRLRRGDHAGTYATS